MLTEILDHAVTPAFETMSQMVGAGTGGALVSNLLVRKLDLREWAITVVDRGTQHVYQPGLLFLPLLVFLRAGSDYLGNYCVGTFDAMPPNTPRSAVIAAASAFLACSNIVAASQASLPAR